MAATVTTFEAVDGQAHEIAKHDSMSAASAHLPTGAYTTFRTYEGNRVLRLGQHLRRLEESVTLMSKGESNIDDDAARRAIAHAIRNTSPIPRPRLGHESGIEGEYAESRFRLTFAPPRLFISVEPFAPYPQSHYDEGVWCVTVSLHRNNPHAKSTTFIASAADAYKALPQGANEGLMIADDGVVLEGLSSNFFAITDARDGRGEVTSPLLRTEEARVLIGVTRSLVLEVAREVLSVSTEAVKYNDLPQVRECFITSVSREILPVVKIDQLVISDGKPGPITRELMRRFRELVDREAQPLV